MTDVFTSIPLCCPLDGLVLNRQQASFSCAKGHSYDVAKQGYINLLPVQFKSSKDPGDSKSMVAARRSVLDQGYYEPLSDQLCELAVELLASHSGNSSVVIDAGCGEGYYSARLHQHLVARSGSDAPPVLATDISKWSVVAAARTYKNLACAVATNKHLPVLQGSAVLITSLFGFATWRSWSELQKPGQCVVTADPGPNHLLELRELIYDEVRVHDVTDDPEAEDAGYRCVNRRTVSCKTQVGSSQDLLAILEMTPHGRRVTPEKRGALQSAGSLPLSMDVVLRVFERQERDPLQLEPHPD